MLERFGLTSSRTLVIEVEGYFESILAMVSRSPRSPWQASSNSSFSHSVILWLCSFIIFRFAYSYPQVRFHTYIHISLGLCSLLSVRERIFIIWPGPPDCEGGGRRLLIRAFNPVNFNLAFQMAWGESFNGYFWLVLLYLIDIQLVSVEGLIEKTPMHSVLWKIEVEKSENGP